MKETILGMDPTLFARDLKNKKLRCVLIAVGAVLMNVLLTALRNDVTHVYMLVGNIAVDVLAGWYLVWYCSAVLEPLNTRHKLYKAIWVEHRVRVQAVSQKIRRVRGLDCREISVGERVLFLPEWMTVPEAGQSCTFYASAGVIVEVRYE